MSSIHAAVHIVQVRDGNGPAQYQASVFGPFDFTTKWHDTANEARAEMDRFMQRKKFKAVSRGTGLSESQYAWDKVQ